MNTRSGRLAVLVAAIGVAGTALPAMAHNGNFLVYRTSAGKLMIEYAWPLPTSLDEVLVPYRGDVINILVERLIIPNVAGDRYPPDPGTQIYLQVMGTLPQIYVRDGNNPTNVLLGSNDYFCGTGGSAWSGPGVWVHADQFHPGFNWAAPEFYADFRVIDLTGHHAPSQVYRMRTVPFHYCAADFTNTAIAGTEGYGIPNNVVNNDDFFFYLSEFAAGSWRADLTTSALAGAPGFGDPNGLVTNDDFFYYLTEYVNGCHF